MVKNVIILYLIFVILSLININETCYIIETKHQIEVIRDAKFDKVKIRI